MNFIFSCVMKYFSLTFFQSFKNVKNPSEPKGYPQIPLVSQTCPALASSQSVPGAQVPGLLNLDTPVPCSAPGSLGSSPSVLGLQSPLLRWPCSSPSALSPAWLAGFAEHTQEMPVRSGKGPAEMGKRRRPSGHCSLLASGGRSFL